MTSSTMILAACLLAPTPEGDFRGWFEAARLGKLEVPGEVEQSARRFRYVFVGGFSAEHSTGSFAQNAKELRASGVPRKAIHFVYPNSDRTIEENADEVRDALFAAAAKGPERLVVIAHSRGACDTLAFALHQPDFVRDRVEALFLLQGPFGGSGLADYVAGEGPEIDRRMPLKYRVLARLIGRVERARLSKGRHVGLLDLTRSNSRRFWPEILAAHADAIPIVGPKTLFVTTATHPSRLPMIQKTMAHYLEAYFGPNDGLLSPDDQSLPQLGTVVAVIEAGHADLTNRFPASKARPRVRKALVKAILMTVGTSTSRG